MRDDLIFGLSVSYLSIALNVAATEKPSFLGSFGFQETDFRFILAIGTDDDLESDIFCLGSVITHYSILTTASCFEEQTMEYALGPAEVTHESDEERRKLRAKRRAKSKGNRPRRKKYNCAENTGGQETVCSEVRGERYGAVRKVVAQKLKSKKVRARRRTKLKTKRIRRKRQDGDDDGDGINDSEGTTESGDPDESAPKTMPYSLFRIDAQREAFVRLRLKGGEWAPHVDFEKCDDVKMWKNDVAFLLTETMKPLSLTKIRAVPLTTVGFGEFIKSLHEQVVNTMSCQVIGLIEYNEPESNFYSAWDTKVKLVAHDVLVVYDKCNNTVCLEEEDECHNTGHHILKDPSNLMPSFLPGSPLLCEGKLLSVVNTKSHCDDTKYSAEFTQPEVVRHLLKQFGFFDKGTVLGRTAPKVVIPNIPKPTWSTKGGPRGTVVLSAWHLGLAVFVNLLWS